MSANNNSSTLKAYVDSATGAVQNTLGSIVGSRGDEVSSIQSPRTASPAMGIFSSHFPRLVHFPIEQKD